MSPVEGYGIVQDGALDLRTISASRRHALIRGLFLICRERVLLTAPDGELEARWAELKPADATLYPIVIRKAS